MLLSHGTWLGSRLANSGAARGGNPGSGPPLSPPLEHAPEQDDEAKDEASYGDDPVPRRGRGYRIRYLAVPVGLNRDGYPTPDTHLSRVAIGCIAEHLVVRPEGDMERAGADLHVKRVIRVLPANLSDTADGTDHRLQAFGVESRGARARLRVVIGGNRRGFSNGAGSDNQATDQKNRSEAPEES